jgi:hypothetical protein
VGRRVVAPAAVPPGVGVPGVVAVAPGLPGRVPALAPGTASRLARRRPAITPGAIESPVVKSREKEGYIGRPARSITPLPRKTCTVVSAGRPPASSKKIVGPSQ